MRLAYPLFLETERRVNSAWTFIAPIAIPVFAHLGFFIGFLLVLVVWYQLELPVGPKLH